MKVFSSGLLIAPAMLVFGFAAKLSSPSENKSKTAAGEGIRFMKSNWNKVLDEAKSKTSLFSWIPMLAAVDPANS